MLRKPRGDEEQQGGDAVRLGWGWADMPQEVQVVHRRLADQINYFDKRSVQNQKRFLLKRRVVIMSAALVTVAGALGLPGWVPASLGAAILIVDGFLALDKNLENWLDYRRTCEDLKHEKYLYLSRAGDYADDEAPEALLALRTELILKSDHGKWSAARYAKLQEAGAQR